MPIGGATLASRIRDWDAGALVIEQPLVGLNQENQLGN
jgi:hypothetical protein